MYLGKGHLAMYPNVFARTVLVARSPRLITHLKLKFQKLERFRIYWIFSDHAEFFWGVLFPPIPIEKCNFLSSTIEK